MADTTTATTPEVVYADNYEELIGKLGTKVATPETKVIPPADSSK